MPADGFRTLEEAVSGSPTNPTFGFRPALALALAKSGTDRYGKGWPL